MLQWLREDEFFSSRLLRLRDVPHHKPAFAAQQLDAADAAQPDEQPLDLGKLKQKRFDLRWDICFVHQVMVWVGSSRSGRGANERTRLQKETAQPPP